MTDRPIADRQDQQYRVLAIAPTPFFVDRGGHVQIYEQARALQKLGNTVELCTYHIGRDMPGIETHRIANIPWYNKTDAGPSYQKLYLMILLFFLSWREIRRFKPDILHGHGWDGCWIAFALSKLTGVPFVFDMQGSFTGEIVAHGYAKTNSLFFKLLKWIERRTLHLGHVVTQSEQMVQDAIRDFGVRPNRIFHTFDGVDTDDLHPGIEAPELRQQLNLPTDKKIVVFLGLLKPYQGVDSLLDAIRILVQDLKYTSAHFLIMGFPDEDKYRAKAESLGIGAHTTFPGKIDYKQRKLYYALGSLAVAPKLSPTEGDGKIYDYLAMGLPIVAYDRPASKEILGDLAFFAELGNSHSLACALQEALTNETRAVQLGRKGREMALEKFSWLAVGKRLVIAYETVIGRSGRSHKS
jgi:glycosyltransferase involved in cell wall biosynthesis